LTFSIPETAEEYWSQSSFSVFVRLGTAEKQEKALPPKVVPRAKGFGVL